MSQLRSGSVPWPHLLLGLSVVGVWGTNFVVIRMAVEHMPPFLFAALRFSLAACPCVFLIRRPKVGLANLASYGLLIGVGNFGLLFIAMQGRISPGLASLVIQMQVFFTIGLAVALNGDRVRPPQWIGLILGFAGIALIGVHADTTTTPLGLVLVLGAAFAWACGNIAAKRSGATDMLAYVVWSSLFAAPVLFAMSAVFDGWPAIIESLSAATSATWAAVVWQSVGNTLFGYAAWAWLLAKYETAVISPLALLVPIFGLGASSLLLGEPLPPWKLAAAGLVIAGLLVGVFLPILKRSARF